MLLQPWLNKARLTCNGSFLVVSKAQGLGGAMVVSKESTSNIDFVAGMFAMKRVERILTDDSVV